MDVPAGSPLCLNLGAGGMVVEGYLSVDLAGEPDVRADIRALPFDDGAVDALMAIHVLEHIPRWQARETLIEWARVLRPGGLLAIEVPDLVKCCQNILLGKASRAGLWGLFGDPGYQSELMCHRWAYSAEELVGELKASGFRRCRVRDPQFHKNYRDMRIEATK